MSAVISAVIFYMKDCYYAEHDLLATAKFVVTFVIVIQNIVMFYIALMLLVQEEIVVNC